MTEEEFLDTIKEEYHEEARRFFNELALEVGLSWLAADRWRLYPTESPNFTLGVYPSPFAAADFATDRKWIITSCS